MSVFRRKRVLYGLGVVLLLLVGSLAALRMYLSSDALAHEVAGRLQEMLGSNVRLGGVQVGVTGGSSLRGLAVYEGQSAADEKPWIEISDVDADVSALDLVRGRNPQIVHLRGPQVRLHFAADNHLLTHLPSLRPRPGIRLPQIDLAGGQVTIEQDGRPPFVIQGVQATVTGPGPGVQVKGTIDDPAWGHCDAEAAYDPEAHRFSLRLACPRRHLTMEDLRAVPFVSNSVWEAVQLEGDSGVLFTLSFQPPGDGTPAAQGSHYRVELEPRQTRVHVSSIDLDADNASGKVVVADKVVDLTGVRGQSADGEIRTDAVLDFRRPTSQLQFKIDVARLVLHLLPRSWKIPSKLDGRLTGHADLLVSVIHGKAVTHGAGEGRIEGATLAGIHLKKPIRLSLKADESGIHFHRPSSEPTGGLPWLYTVALVAPPEQPSPLDEALSEALDVPIALAQAVAGGTMRAVDATAKTLHRISSLAKRPPGAGHEYVDADLSLTDVDVHQLLTGLDVAVPFPLAGRLTVQIHLGVPLDAPHDLKAYRLRGDGTFHWLDIAGVRLRDVKASVRYDNGLVELADLRGQVPPEATSKAEGGSFAGTARMQLIPAGDLSASLRIDRIAVARVLAFLPGIEAMQGRVSGAVNASVAARRIQDPAAWQISGALHSDELSLQGLTLSHADAHIMTAHGVASVRDLQAQLAGAPLTATAELRLSDPYRYTAGLRLDRMDLSALDHLARPLRMPIDLAGSLSVDANLEGTLRPASLNASGSAHAAPARLAGISFDSLAGKWTLPGNVLELRQLVGQVNGGEVTGSATIPLVRDADGRADLKLRDVNAAKLLGALPSMPVRVEGELSGTLQGTLSAEAPGRPRALSTQLELSAPRLRVQGIPAERLRGHIDYKGGAGEYGLQGDTLGGRFQLQGKLPPRPAAAPAPAAPEPPPDGRLTIEGVRLNRLAAALGWRGVLHGVLSVDVPFRHEGPNGMPVGQGAFRIRDLRWDDQDLSSEVLGDVQLDAEGLHFRRISGTLAQGLFRASLALPFHAQSGGSFSLTLTHADAAQLLHPWPAFDEHIQGPVDISLRGRIDGEWHGGGNLALSRGRIFGIEINEWRIPLRLAFSPRQARGELILNDTNAVVGMGRALGRARLTWGEESRLEGNVRFFDVDLRSLMSGAGDVGTLASGRLTGRIELDGTEIHSSNDVTAVLTATLSQAQAMQLPVLRQVLPFLRGGSSSATFQSGQIEARLAHGVIRLQRLTLEGGLLNLIVEGTITLEGRLNLEITARTGGGPLFAPGLRLLALRVASASALPVTIITEASLLLANRVVHLRVTGTLRNPIVQVEPVRLLTEEAVRYFLSRALFSGL